MFCLSWRTRVPGPRDLVKPVHPAAAHLSKFGQNVGSVSSWRGLGPGVGRTDSMWSGGEAINSWAGVVVVLVVDGRNNG